MRSALLSWRCKNSASSAELLECPPRDEPDFCIAPLPVLASLLFFASNIKGKATFESEREIAWTKAITANQYDSTNYRMRRA